MTDADESEDAGGFHEIERLAGVLDQGVPTGDERGGGAQGDQGVDEAEGVGCDQGRSKK